MIPEAPLIFSVAGLSASFAGLAGLVMALRRGADIRAVDRLRLRQMVEFSFVNIVLAVLVIPLAAALGSTAAAAQVDAVVIGLYAVLTIVVNMRRTQSSGIRWSGWWTVSVLGLAVATVACAAFVVATAAVAAFEMLLVLILVRPMLPFLLVLDSWETEADG